MSHSVLQLYRFSSITEFITFIFIYYRYECLKSKFFVHASWGSVRTWQRQIRSDDVVEQIGATPNHDDVIQIGAMPIHNDAIVQIGATPIRDDVTGLRLLSYRKNTWLRMMCCLQIIWQENRKSQWMSWSAAIPHGEDVVQADCD